MHVLPNGAYDLYGLLLTKLFTAFPWRIWLCPGRLAFTVDSPQAFSLQRPHGFLLSSDTPCPFRMVPGVLKNTQVDREHDRHI